MGFEPATEDLKKKNKTLEQNMFFFRTRITYSQSLMVSGDRRCIKIGLR